MTLIRKRLLRDRPLLALETFIVELEKMNPARSSQNLSDSRSELTRQEQTPKFGCQDLVGTTCDDECDWEHVLQTNSDVSKLGNMSKEHVYLLPKDSLQVYRVVVCIFSQPLRNIRLAMKPVANRYWLLAMCHSGCMAHILQWLAGQTKLPYMAF